MMAKIGAKLRNLKGGKVAFWCPGCQRMHAVTVVGNEHPRWTWNNDADRPTFSPSVLVYWDGWEPPATPENMNLGPQTKVSKRCHSFVKDGRIQFLGDCTHALAGQTVDLPDVD